MPNKHAFGTIAVLSLTLAALGVLGGCAEIQQVAMEAQRQSTGWLAKTVHEGEALVSGPPPIGYEEEQSIGAAIALQVVARYGGVYDQPEITRYVNLVGRAVALTCNRPNIAYHFAVLNHDSLNAFAAPAGYVFVTRGLLKHIRTEAELAAVLGHEIAHISEKHILEIMQRNRQLAGITKHMPEVFKEVIDTAVQKLLDEGLDRNTELEADRLGVRFAARVGYDPTAYTALLKRLRAAKGDNHAIFKTHPTYSTRIEAVQEVVQTEGWTPRGARLTERFAARAGGLL